MFTTYLFPGRKFKTVEELENAKNKQKEQKDILERLRLLLEDAKVANVKVVGGKKTP